MPLELKQQLRLTQQLVMTPQLQQAIRLLQLSRLELVDAVREEMMDNPVLEDEGESAQEQARERAEFDVDGRSEASVAAVGETEVAASEPVPGEKQAEVTLGEQAVNEIDWANYLEDYAAAPAMPSYRSGNDDLPSIEATLSKRTSLFDHLAWQLDMSSMDEAERTIGMLILGNLDGDGYLRDPTLEEIVADARASQEMADSVLSRVQHFDPVGVAARTLEECLLLQYAGVDDLVVAIIKGHLHNLEKKDYLAIARDLKEPVEEIYEAVKVILDLDPRPGQMYSTAEPRYITPDVYVHKVGDRYFVVANDDGLPRLKISSVYRRGLSGSKQSREYIQDKLRSAQWLIRAIQQRQRTIVRVMESIIKFQADFFDKGIAYLKPMILRDVADDISMHESTISRVTSSKYVHTPQGIFELKYFFSSGISSTDGHDVASKAVKSSIKKIISAEDPQRPHSDQKIVELLRDQRIDIARRTVAKYREELGVLSSSRRKKVF